MTIVALTKGPTTLRLLVLTLIAIPIIILMTVRGLLAMRTLPGHRATTPDTINPQAEMPIVLSLRTWNLKKYESFLLTRMLRLMTPETKNIAHVALQSLIDAIPSILLLTKHLPKSLRFIHHHMFPVIFMLLPRHQSHTLIHSLSLNNMSNITPHTPIHAIGPHLRSYMHRDLITIPIIMPHRQSSMPQPRHRV
jgi:hypothetical protein